MVWLLENSTGEALYLALSTIPTTFSFSSDWDKDKISPILNPLSANVWSMTISFELSTWWPLIIGGIKNDLCVTPKVTRFLPDDGLR